jgi:uncharacterized protein YneF (UPF0154 family)
MNDLTKTPKKKMNEKMLWFGVAISVIVILIGGIIDSSHIFGKEGTLPIQVSVCILTGMIIGVTWISAKTGVKVKELLC